MQQFLRAIFAMDATDVLKRLISEEKLSRGVKLREAIRIIAREAGVSPSSLDNLGRGRLKYVDQIAGKLNDLLVKKIEQRIQSFQHELELCRAAQNIAAVDLETAAAFLEKARRALGK